MRCFRNFIMSDETHVQVQLLCPHHNVSRTKPTRSALLQLCVPTLLAWSLLPYVECWQSIATLPLKFPRPTRLRPEFQASTRGGRCSPPPAVGRPARRFAGTLSYFLAYEHRVPSFHARLTLPRRWLTAPASSPGSSRTFSPSRLVIIFKAAGCCKGAARRFHGRSSRVT